MIINTISGILVAQLLASLAYLLISYYITLFFSKERINSYQTFEEVNTSCTAFKYGVPLSIIFKSIVKPYLNIYISFSKYTLSQNFILFLLYFILFDFINYILHRILHIRIIYKYIHLDHHRYKDPSPFGSIAINPIEFFLNSVIPSSIVSYFLPTNIYVWMFSYMFHLFWTVIIHDGIKFKSNDILMDSKHHGIHHRHPKKNYAFVFFFWDKLFGTSQD